MITPTQNSGFDLAVSSFATRSKPAEPRRSDGLNSASTEHRAGASATTLSVSVVIPAYRAAATIRRAIDSVLAQTYQPLEILVIDDGSPEELGDVLANYGDRVRLVRQANQGASAARNQGIELARGDLVALLDADDEWLAHKLERCVEIFAAHPTVGLVASRYFLQDEQGHLERIAGPHERRCGRAARPLGAEILEFAREISTPTVVVRRELLRERRFDTSLVTAEDRDLWLRLVLAADVWLLAEPLCRVFYRPDSLSHRDIDVDCHSMRTVLDRYREPLGWLTWRREVAYVEAKWAAGLRRHSGAAVGHLLRSLWAWPLPLSAERTRCWLARPRTLVAIVRRALRRDGAGL